MVRARVMVMVMVYMVRVSVRVRVRARVRVGSPWRSTAAAPPAGRGGGTRPGLHSAATRPQSA